MLHRSYLLLLPLALGWSGCATTAPVSAANVNRAIGPRNGLEVAWPQTPDETRAIDDRVGRMLQEPLTPESAAAIAVLNNRHLRARLEDVGVSAADVLAASRLANPSLSLRARWPDSAPRPPNVELNLGLDLLNGLLLPLRRKFSGEQLATTESEVAFEILELAAQAKAATYTVQADEEFLLRVQAMGDTNAAAAEFAQRQYDAGNISRLDLLDQQAAAQETRLEIQHAQAALQRAREEVNRRLGLSGAQIDWRMSAGLPPAPAADPARDQIESAALAQRLDLKAAAQRVAIAGEALRLRRETRLLPASIGFGVDTESNATGQNGRGRLTGPSLDLALPIFDQGQGEIARLSAEARRAEDNYEALQSDVHSEVRSALAAVRSARSIAEYHDQTLLPQRREILNETLLQYNAMQKSNYDLLAAKLQLVSAERERIAAWRDYWIARTELERAAGGRLDPP